MPRKLKRKPRYMLNPHSIQAARECHTRPDADQIMEFSEAVRSALDDLEQRLNPDGHPEITCMLAGTITRKGADLLRSAGMQREQWHELATWVWDVPDNVAPDETDN